MRHSPDLVPMSVITQLTDMHYKHLEQITKLFMDHLEKLNVPVVVRNGDGQDRLWMSEDDEDEQALSYKAELATLADLAREQGVDLGDFHIER